MNLPSEGGISAWVSSVATTSMNFGRLQWLFPFAVTVHNAEEAIWMPSWDARHAADLPVQPPGAFAFRIALVVLTVAACVITHLSARRGRQSVWSYLVFGYIVTMLANVVVPHVPAAIVFRGYVPGVATAVLINLPLMSFLVVRAVSDGWVSGWKAVAVGTGVPLGIGGSILTWFHLHL